MNRRIKVKLPLNLDINDTCDFTNVGYDLYPLKVYELSNVLITYEGICLINSCLVKESIHGYLDKITIYALTAKLNILNHKTILLNDSNYYLLIHSPMYSYYHWLTESIPRLLMVKSQIKNLTLLLPVSLKNVDFVQESLRPFPIKNIVYIPKNINIKVKHLVLPQIKPYFTSYYPEVVNEIRELYTNYLTKYFAQNKKLNDKLCLSDKIENKHEIYNIEEVCSLLDLYNISYLNILNCSFYDQVQSLQSTKLLISLSGDDLACINFMKKGTSILELLKTQTSEIDQPSLIYLNLASNLELNYYYQFCTPVKSHHIKNCSKLIVDLNLFEKNIKLILRK